MSDIGLGVLLLHITRALVGQTASGKCGGFLDLGVITDNGLTWSKHISAIKAGMSRYVFVQPHLDYCSFIWGFAAISHIIQ